MLEFNKTYMYRSNVIDRQGKDVSNRRFKVINKNLSTSHTTMRITKLGTDKFWELEQSDAFWLELLEPTDQKVISRRVVLA